MDCSMPGLPVYHQLPEFTQTHDHWDGDAIQPSHPVVLFSSHLQSFPESGSFPMNQFFALGGQNIRATASVLPMNIQGWFPLGWAGWISLQSKGLSKVFSNTTVQKHQFFSSQPSLMVQLSHLYMTTGKTIALTVRTFVSRVTSLFFNRLSRIVITFLPRRTSSTVRWGWMDKQSGSVQWNVTEP